MDEKAPTFDVKITPQNLALGAKENIKWPDYQVTKAKEWALKTSEQNTEIENFFNNTYSSL